MTDFKIAFLDDELLYREYEKMSLISKIVFKAFYDNLKLRLHNLLEKVLLQRKRMSHYGFGIFNCKYSFFHQQHFILLDST